MLPKTARMRSSEELRQAVRHGVRMGRPTLVVHASRADQQASSRLPDVQRVGDSDVRVAFVVSKAVGNAVTRNRVKRRLRHLATASLPVTPPGTRIVVRALPRAATNPGELPDDLHKAWEKALHRLNEPPRRVSRRATP